jgi:hypothetical protein
VNQPTPAELVAALRRLSQWFKSELEPDAVSSAEHLLSGCPNELRANLERARALIDAAEGGGQ